MESTVPYSTPELITTLDFKTTQKHTTANPTTPDISDTTQRHSTPYLATFTSNYETIEPSSRFSSINTSCAGIPLTHGLPNSAYSTTCLGNIPESQNPEKAKLDGPEPWCCDSVFNSATASLEIDLGNMMRIDSIETQVSTY